MRKRFFITYSLCALAVLSLGWSLDVPKANAASEIDYVPLAPIDVEGSEFRSDQTCKAPDCFPRYLRTIYNIGIGLAGLFAVISIVRGGFTLMFTDSILGHSEAKGIILRAVGGVLIVYSSYILMNTVSPALGRDLNLSLAFKRAEKTPETALLQVVTLTDLQLQNLRESTAARKAELEKRIGDSRAEIERNEEQLEDMEEGYAKEDLRARNRELQRQIAADNLALAHNTARLGSLEASNAQSLEAAQIATTNITKAGGTVAQIREKFTAARTALASDPGALADSYYKEMTEIAVLNKSLAFGFIDHPPAKPGITRPDLTRGEVDLEKLNSLVLSRIQDIQREERAQAGNLFNLGAGTTLSAIQKRTVLEQIHARANEQICQIKYKCQDKNIECRKFATAVLCPNYK